MKKEKIKQGPCEKATDQLIDLMVIGQLDDASFDELCEQYDNCQPILQDLYATWSGLDKIEVPAPSQKMHTRFYKSLSEWNPEEEDKKGKIIDLQPLFVTGKDFVLRYGVAAGLFLGGLATGMIAFSVLNNEQATPYVSIPEETNNVRTVSTTSDRLVEIQSLKQKTINNKIIDALYQALIKDPSTNVRLSAIEAMLPYANNPDVRQNLINAIPYQTTPIVQLTLAEVMIELEDKTSSEAWHQLLQSEEMELDVKLQLEGMLREII